MGLISIPFSVFSYWLMLHAKKEDPAPKRGLLRLLIAGALSVVLSIVLNIPLSAIISFFRFGVLSNPDEWLSAIRTDPAALTEMVQNAKNNIQPTFLFNLISMFITAGLLEEGLKFLTCRTAIRKEGTVRTWMDSVVCFAVVGITFEFLENIAFGMNLDFISALVRSLGCAHFVFGVIMGYFFGKYCVTGQKKYAWLSFAIPLIYHTVTNALMASIELNKVYNVLGSITGISHMVATVVTVIIVLRWQKNRTLDVSVLQKKQKIERGGTT